jgi:hypothetical protein
MQEQVALQQTRQELARAVRDWERDDRQQEPLLTIIRKAEELLTAIEEPPDGPPGYFGQVQKQLKSEAAVARGLLEQHRQDREKRGKPRY